MHPVSAKGKAREDAHWQLGWWEVYPLVDGPHRPIAWSRSSIIFTPHTVQPFVMARHFPSSRQFTLPSHPQIIESPIAYEPPTVITVSPFDDWLFAYFPSREGDGLGCLWRRQAQIDTWVAKESWSFARGAGVVCADWTCTERSWVVGETGAPYRLPPRGPSLPMNTPTLLLVTETLYLHACFLPSSVPHLRIVKVPLQQTGGAHAQIMPAVDTSSAPEEPPSDSVGGRKTCVRAAIGFSYNEPAILVAMHSKLLPPSGASNQKTTFNAMDLGITLDIPQEDGAGGSSQANSPPSVNEWEQWGDESTIDLCAVAIDFNGFLLTLRTRPCPPIFRPGSQLTDLKFFSVPPDAVPVSPSITRDPRRPAKEASLSEKGSTYLAATFLDFEDYTSLPKQQVSIYSMSRFGQMDITWYSKHQHTRTFDQGVLAFLAPGLSRGTVLAGFMDATGNTPRQSTKVKETRIGSMSLLKLPDLSHHDGWEHSHIVSSVDGIGRDIPVGIALSPNSALLCSIAPSATLLSRISVHALPHRLIPPTQPSPARSDLCRALVQAIYSRRTPSDVIHAMTSPSMQPDVLVSTLYGALAILEAHPFGLSECWLDDVLGIVVEVYLTRAKASAKEADKIRLAEQWQTVHDICSVSALNLAFEECREDKLYDIEAIWQLVGLSNWLMSLVERLMKQCIFVAEGNPSPKAPYKDIAEGGDSDPLSFADASILLHLVHPYALRNLHAAVCHLERFQAQISPLVPKAENAQLAKDALMDIVNTSGVSLTPLIPLLDEFQKNVPQIPADELRKALVGCSITPPLRPFIRQAINKIIASTVINRPRLFIKASDLVDGISKLSITERLRAKESDVVSKGLLLHRGSDIICVRCGGKSEKVEKVAGLRAPDSTSVRWKAWEMMWAAKCVCGGAWVTSLS